MQFLGLRRFTLENLPTRIAKAYASHLPLLVHAKKCTKRSEDLALFGSICALDLET